MRTRFGYREKVRRFLHLIICSVIWTLSLGSAAEAWGFLVHRFINERACLALPEEMEAFRSYSHFLGEHSADVDFLKQIHSQERPHHFMDIDVFDVYPFRNLPRSKAGMIARFGEKKVREVGLLPWTIGEVTEKLVDKMRSGGDHQHRFGWVEAAWLAAALGHYAADNHQPLHTTKNYDGQLTGNDGIHLRFECDMMNKHLEELTLSPVEVSLINDPVDFAFDSIREAWRGVEEILTADRIAKRLSPGYGDAYYQSLWEQTGELAQKQIQRAVEAVANLWYTAWVNADRPEIVPFEEAVKSAK